MTPFQERKHAKWLLSIATDLTRDGQQLKRFGKRHIHPENSLLDALANGVAGAVYIMGRRIHRKGEEARKRGRLVLMRQEWSMSGRSDLPVTLFSVEEVLRDLN